MGRNVARAIPARSWFGANGLICLRCHLAFDNAGQFINHECCPIMLLQEGRRALEKTLTDAWPARPMGYNAATEQLALFETIRDGVAPDSAAP